MAVSSQSWFGLIWDHKLQPRCFHWGGLNLPIRHLGQKKQVEPPKSNDLNVSSSHLRGHGPMKITGQGKRKRFCRSTSGEAQRRRPLWIYSWNTLISDGYGVVCPGWAGCWSGVGPNSKHIQSFGHHRCCSLLARFSNYYSNRSHFGVLNFLIFSLYLQSFLLISQVTVLVLGYCPHMPWDPAACWFRSLSYGAWRDLHVDRASNVLALQCLTNLVEDKLWQHEWGELPPMFAQSALSKISIVQLMVAFRTTVFMSCAVKMWLWRRMPLLLGAESVNYFVTDRSLGFWILHGNDWTSQSKEDPKDLYIEVFKSNKGGCVVKMSLFFTAACQPNMGNQSSRNPTILNIITVYQFDVGDLFHLGRGYETFRIIKMCFVHLKYFETYFETYYASLYLYPQDKS